MSVRSIVKRGVRRCLARVESRALRDATGPEHAPLFIVAPPRSGSTLLYILCVRVHRHSYFTNFAMACPASPGTMAMVEKLTGLTKRPVELSNRLGETPGANGPNQGYRFWNEWLPTDEDFIDPASVPREAKEEIRRRISLVERAGRAPFVNKWQRNAVRVRLLADIFPNALFVRLRRDARFIAQSIVRARRGNDGEDSGWLSAVPRSYQPDPAHSLVHQVCNQVFWIEKDLDQDEALIGRERFFSLGYGELCREPADAMEKIRSWYRERDGYELEKRNVAVPALSESRDVRLPEDEFRRIEETLATLESTQRAKPEMG